MILLKSLQYSSKVWSQKDFSFIQQGCITLIRSDPKDIDNVTKDFCLK